MAVQVTDAQRREYRGILGPAVMAVKRFRGTEASANEVLAKAISAEDWIKATFPHNNPCEVERELVKVPTDPSAHHQLRSTPTFQSLLGRCVARLPKIFANVFHTRTDAQSNDPAVVARELNLVHVALSDVLLPPGSPPMGTLLNGARAEFQPPVFQPRISDLILALPKIGLFTDDIILYSGKLFPTQMREVSYALLEIPRLRCEILVCNQVGEATFVSKVLLGSEFYKRATKEELEAHTAVTRFVYSTKDEWTKAILDCLGSRQVEEKINVRDMAELREAIMARWTAKEFGGFKAKERLVLKLSGKGLTAIARIFGTKGIPTHNYKDHLKLCAAIWGEDHPDIKDKLIKARVDASTVATLGNNPQKWQAHLAKLGHSAATFSQLNSTQREEFRIAEMGLKAIAGIFGTKAEPAANYKDHLELCAAIWGEEHPDIKDKLIKARADAATAATLGTSHEKWRNHLALLKYTAATFSQLTYPQRGELRIAGMGLKAIAGIFGTKGQPVGTYRDHLELCAAIWGADHAAFKDQLTKERADAVTAAHLGTSSEKWQAHLASLGYTAATFSQLTSAQRLELEIAGMSLETIAGIFGTMGQPASINGDHLKLCAAIWGEDHPDIKDKLIKARADAATATTLGASPEKWQAHLASLGYSATTFSQLNGTQRDEFRIAGMGLKAIAGIFGTKGYPITSNRDLLKLCAAIWGEDHPDLKKDLANARADAATATTLGTGAEKWRDHLALLGHTAATFSQLTSAQRDELRIAGMGLRGDTVNSCVRHGQAAIPPLSST